MSSRPTNFTVIRGGGYVDIAPNPEVAFSAEILRGIIAQIKTELDFKGSVAVGTGVFFNERIPKFGMRLNGATAAMAEELRGMDLFPPRQAELSTLEVRFVHDNLAYIDPRLVVTIGTMVEFASALGAYFRKRASFWLQDTQFVFDAGTNLLDVNSEMINFCQPMYRYTSKIVGRIKDGHAWIGLEGPAHLVNIACVERLKHVLLDPAPIFHKARSTAWPARVEVAVDTRIVTVADVKHLYELATAMSMSLGIHPLGDFTFVHEQDLSTTFKTPTLSSR